MKRAFRFASKAPRRQVSSRWWMVAALPFLVAASFSVQAQQGNSLADAARQARAQKQVVPKPEDNQAQQVADQLSEEQTSGDAPSGFKTYNAGEYKVSVPAPFTVDGRDEGGAVLAGPSVGSKRAEVLVGTPIVFAWAGSDAAFHDTAVQFASLYQASAKCTKASIAKHDAYQCGLAGANLVGRRVSGNAVFVRVADRIYPLLCAAPTDSTERDILNNPRSSYDDKLYARAALDREEIDVRNVWQKCDTVFQSLRVNPTNSKHATATPTPAGSAQAEQEAASAGPASLADVARRIKQDPGQAAVVPSTAPASAPVESTVPSGFKVHAFQYCSDPRQCWNGSVLVPAEAQLVSSDCKQYAFEVKMQGSPFLLMAGSANSDCGAGGPNLIRWHQLVDPESKRAPGTFSIISSQVAKIDGKAATITTLSFRKGLTDWMGKRAELENNGVQIVVGCIAPRDRFADGDAVCSALIGSIRLP